MCSVAPDVVQDLLGSREGRFRVHHPVSLSRGREVPEKRGAIAQRVKGPEELECAGVERGVEFGQEEAPKQAREDSDRQEEAGSARDPASVIK